MKARMTFDFTREDADTIAEVLGLPQPATHEEIEEWMHEAVRSALDGVYSTLNAQAEETLTDDDD